MKKTLCVLLFVSVCWSCTQNSSTEKFQKNRNNIINVRNSIKEIEIEDVFIGPSTSLYIIDSYLVISDYASQEDFIHLFNKNDFGYVTSFANRGQGPGEITNVGHIGVDELNRKLYVNDHGKQRIFSYDLDSILVNPSYMPKEKMKMNERRFPDRYQYINDTLSIGLIIEPIGNSDFKPSVAKWNMSTGDIKAMKYEHPDIDKKRITFAVSMENDIYVECYIYHDLMTICNLDGELKYNIYGPNWNKDRNKNDYYGNGVICNNKIYVAYSGESSFVNDEQKGIKSNLPTKFLVFDMNGEYLQTLETGYKISRLCYDKENNRIIMSLDDEVQFAYLNLDEIAV